MVKFAGQITGSGGLTVTGGSGSNRRYTPDTPTCWCSPAARTITRAIRPSITRPLPSMRSIALGTGTSCLRPRSSRSRIPPPSLSARRRSCKLSPGWRATAPRPSARKTTAPSSLNINPAANQTYTFAGMIGDVEVLGRGRAGYAVALVIGGQGTEVLTGSILYTGTSAFGTGDSTTITSGTLQIGNGGAGHARAPMPRSRITGRCVSTAATRQPKARTSAPRRSPAGVPSRGRQRYACAQRCQHLHGGTNLNAGMLVAANGAGFGPGHWRPDASTAAPWPPARPAARSRPGAGGQRPPYHRPGGRLVRRTTAPSTSTGADREPNTTLAFNLNLTTSIGSDGSGNPIYGGDLINLGGRD